MKQRFSRTDRLAIFFIDALCILIPLALLACLLLAAKPRQLHKNEEELLYTVTLSAVREEYIHGIQTGTPVLDAVSKRPIG